MYRRNVEVGDKEHVDQRDQEEHDRRHQTEGQERVFRSRAAEARLRELLLGGLGAQPVGEIEGVDDLFGHARRG